MPCAIFSGLRIYFRPDSQGSGPLQRIKTLFRSNPLYFSLKRFSRLLSLRFDVEAGNKAVVAQRSQAFSHVERLVQEAVGELAILGIIVGGSSFFEMGRVELDFNEPKTLAEF